MREIKLHVAPIAVRGRGVIIRDERGAQESKIAGISFVKDPAESDFVVLSRAIAQVAPARTAIEEARRYAGIHGKKLLVFYYGDHSYREHIPYDDVISFKWSAFADDKLPQEVVTPVFVDDPAEERALTWRHKSKRPVVGFCGFAGFPSVATRLKYYADNAVLDVTSVLTSRPALRARKRGLYFRRKGIEVLARDPRVETRFIIRNSFYNQVPDDAAKLRADFLDNVLGSDLVLAPRGDANISTRFFETLALGRIPLLIDTDCVLPLQAYINYDDFILRVPHTDLQGLAAKVEEWYASLSDEQFVAMQKRARETFEKYLTLQSFFSFVLPLIKERGPEAFDIKV